MTEMPAPTRRALVIVFLIGLTPGWMVAEQAEPPSADPVGGFVYNAAPQGPLLNAETLDGVLEDLDLPDPDGLTLWDRLLLWLDEYFNSSEANAFPDWLSDFRLSATVAQWIFYIVCALIVGLSVAIIANEIRLSRRGASRTSGAPRRASPEHPEEPIVSMDDLPLADRPAHILNSLLQRLPLSQPNGRASSLTHREIRNASSILTPDQRQPLIDVAVVAEQIRYAPAAPQPDQIHRVVAAAASLIDRLDGAR